MTFSEQTRGEVENGVDLLLVRRRRLENQVPEFQATKVPRLRLARPGYCDMGPPQPQEKEQHAVRSSRSQYNGSCGTEAGNDRYTVPA